MNVLDVALALIRRAGFAFRRFVAPIAAPPRTPSSDLDYRKDVVAKELRRARSEDDISQIEVLPEYKLAKRLVDEGFPFVFVTGGAGTGKSTFVRWLVHEYGGKVLLAAPTAMAALNIGGRTLHSLCQLPHAFIKNSDIMFAKRSELIQNARVLIIDEISMVNANMLDGASAFFRKNRAQKEKPFGGISVVLVGDLFQLPPVTSNAVTELFRRVYGTPKFFNARCLQETDYYGLELSKAFRQTDQSYVDLLGQIREGRNLTEAVSRINSRCRLAADPVRGAVWLSPRNVEVDSRNQHELEKIDSPSRTYEGLVTGTFGKDRHALPSPVHLELKVGAQVMFTQNDPERRWINGTIGSIAALTSDNVTVQLEEQSTYTEVRRATWKEYRYEWDEVNGEISRVETGTYTQYPLMLAWAITIHKSQGRTIEHVHLDLGHGAFTTGQTYVALSRCRSLSGLSLSRPLSLTDIRVDPEASRFYADLRTRIQKLPPDELMKAIGGDLGETTKK